MKEMKSMLTVDEVASDLDVSRATIYSEIKKGRIRSILIAGRNRRISRDALNEYKAMHGEGEVK